MAGRRVVAAVRLVTVDFDRECPIGRLEPVGGGPPDDLGRLTVVLAERVEGIDPAAVVDEDET